MNQPCGNVLGRGETHFRFYGRVSPIVCIIDMAVYVPLLVVLSALEGWGRFGNNLRYELARRFGDELGMRFDDEVMCRARGLMGRYFGEDASVGFVERVARDMAERTILSSGHGGDLARGHGDDTTPGARDGLMSRYRAHLAKEGVKDLFAYWLRDRLLSGPGPCRLPASSCEGIRLRFCRDLALRPEDEARYLFFDGLEMEVDAGLVKLCIRNLVTSFSDDMAKGLDEDKKMTERVDAELDRRGEHHDTGDGVKGSQGPTAVRWIILGLGVVPPTVKLVGMHGIPWSQAWVLMFSISVALGEVLLLCHTNWQLDQDGPPEPPRWRANRLALRLRDVPTLLSLFLQTILLVTIISHFLLGVFYENPISPMVLSITFAVPLLGGLMVVPKDGRTPGVVLTVILASLVVVALGPLPGEVVRHFNDPWVPIQPRQAVKQLFETGPDQWAKWLTETIVACAVFCVMVLQTVFYIWGPRLIMVKHLEAVRG